PLELAPPLRVEQLSAREHVHVADETVCGAEDADKLAVEILDPELVAPLFPEPGRRLAPRLGPAFRTRAFMHHLSRDHRARRSPHQLPERVRDVGPDASQQTVFLPGRRREPMCDEQDPGLTAEEGRSRVAEALCDVA